MTALQTTSTDGSPTLEPAGEEERGRGRPRDAGIDVAIREAAWGLLGEVGYEALTFEAVAERAGCSRPALYRRFSSKGELVRAVVHATARVYEPDPAVLADPAGALIAHVQGSIRYLASADGGAVLALSQARRRDPLLSAILDEVLAAERSFYVHALEAAVGGEGRFDAILIADALIGAVMFRVVMCQGALGLEEIEILVDQALSQARKSAR
ncbi:TetR/AcrR family transcriptional regulator [Caulobacter sp. CCUG 60055]|uniref:TetR/AcrR family transcriptional regulator n=1 Tax=Caulobacter sp. CCUG 60055 TaxID=2100090 RepID=UPI001FA6D745